RSVRCRGSWAKGRPSASSPPRAPSKRPSSTCSRTTPPRRPERREGVSYASDARSLGEILAMYEAEGFTAQFGTRPGGRIVCFSCHYEGPATDFELVSLARPEGASD